MRVKILVLALPLFGLLAACRSPSPPPADQAPAEHGYTLVLLKTGPMSGQLPKEENDKLFAGHFSNMERMARAGQLVVAGPFGEKRHDPSLRGLFVLDTATRAIMGDLGLLKVQEKQIVMVDAHTNAQFPSPLRGEG